ncbi:MAG: hypothetical protein K5906_01755 [Bacilli bacterium]|nr:hypothetical protein [Bacilli bacterium]
MNKRKKIIKNIIFYTLLAIIYSIAIFGVVNKFTGGVIYLGNSRLDVVLTDSMSQRNKKYSDFLSNTNQIQTYDMVKSTKINDETELKIKDVVLFNNKALNKTVVHRIVDIHEKGNAFKIDLATKSTFYNHDVIRLGLNGLISLYALDFTSVSIQSYSLSSENPHFTVKVGSETLASTYSSESMGEYYSHSVTFQRDNYQPVDSTIYSPGDYDDYISSITYHSNSGNDVVFNASEFEANESGGYEHLYNKYYLYEIRADKASSSDGTFKRSELIAKVDYIIPKLGYAIKFITSIPGIIMIVGVGIIMVVTSYLLDKNKKKKDETPQLENIEEDKEKK